MGAAQHDLSEIHEKLDAKILELKANLLLVPDIPQNAECRRQMNESLKHTENGKRILFDGCCISQICNFNWNENNSQT